MSGKRLDEAIADAANAQRVAEYRAGLRQRIELPVIKQFAQELENGAGDEIIDSLRGDFDAAAAALAKIKERVEPGVSAEAFLAQADADGLEAWNQFDRHLAVLDRIAVVVGDFGPHGSFELVQPPQGPVAAWAGEIDRRALLFVGPDTNLISTSQTFRACQGGRHRASAWFKLAGVLQLSSIDQAREKVRAWSEATFAATVSDNGRGASTPMRASSILRSRIPTRKPRFSNALSLLRMPAAARLDGRRRGPPAAFPLRSTRRGADPQMPVRRCTPPLPEPTEAVA